MKTNSWTKNDIELLKDKTLCNSAVAIVLNRSEAAVRGKRQRLGIGTPEVKPPPTTFTEDKSKADSSYWMEQHRVLKSKYDQALKHGSVTEQLVGLAKNLAPKSYDPFPPYSILKKSGPGAAQSAILLLSDTHVGQVVTADQTLGFGGYNFEIFLARLKFLEDGVTSILKDHTTTKIDELVICLGGDMIHGALDHGAEAAQHSTLFEQFYGAGHALALFLRNVARVVPRVRVYSTCGNHPRWKSQHKMPTDNRYSNLDLFLAAYVEALTRNIPQISWSLDKQPFTVFDVQGFKFHLSHGDHLRGGDKALGIPNHAVGRAISSTTQLFGKYGETAPHYYLTGHLHRSIVLPHAKGSFIVNGGWPGIDGYGLAGGFSPVDPTQVFFLVHPKFGKTATYDIQLKFAPVGPRPYVLPETFIPA